MSNLTMLKMWLQTKLGKFLLDEKGEVNIVAMVILIGIAVILAIIFKDAIVGLINNLLNQINGNVNNVMNQPS